MHYGSYFIQSSRIIERPEGTPDNVKTAAWIPQVDILSDPKTKVFISHCGNHGAHEDGFNTPYGEL